MSRFRRERIHASVEPDRVALVRVAASGEILAEHMLQGGVTEKQPARALDRVGAVLAEPGWRDVPRRVVLSDRLAHSLVFERPAGLRSMEELRLAVAARFETAFDAAAGEWDIEIDARPMARRFFACAVPRAVRAAIQSTFGATGPCDHVQPYLVSALNAHARALPDLCWFAAVAQDCVTLAQVADGACQSVRVMPLDQPDPQAIAEAIARERLLAGDIDAATPVLAAGVLDGLADNLKRVDRAQWGTRPASWTPAYRVALAGVWP